MNPSTPTDKVDRAVPHWFVLIQCNRISTTQKCLASQEQQGLAPETLQVGSHGKKGIAGQTSNRPAVSTQFHMHHNPSVVIQVGARKGRPHSSTKAYPVNLT